MITKKLFCEVINEIQKHYLNIKSIHEIFNKINKDNQFFGLNDSLLVTFTNVLAEAMDDKEGMIDYFMYELDFGQENYRLRCYDENKKEIPMSAPEDLYKYFLKRSKKKQTKKNAVKKWQQKKI